MSDNLFKDALDKYGHEPQLRQLQEECGELIVAINHYLCGRACAVDELVEEVADVHIMIQQIEYWLAEQGYHDRFAQMWERKLDRLERRLNKEWSKK